MTVTINAWMDNDVGTEIGLRFYKESDPDTQVGADRFLSQDTDGPITSLYEGVAEVLQANTNYNVGVYNTNGASVITTFIVNTVCYVGDDGGTYWLGSTPDIESQATVTSLLNQLKNLVVVAAARIPNVVNGMPATLIKDDEYSVANGNAVKLYIVDEAGDPVIQSGTLMFNAADRIKLGLSLHDSTTIEVELDGTYEEPSDEYFQFVWDENALDVVTDNLADGYEYHRWGLKVSWSGANEITVASGFCKVAPKFVSSP